MCLNEERKEGVGIIAQGEGHGCDPHTTRKKNLALPMLLEYPLAAELPLLRCQRLVGCILEVCSVPLTYLFVLYPVLLMLNLVTQSWY